MRTHHRRVGRGQHGRGIQDHHVVLRGQLAQGRAEHGRGQQFRRVEGDRAGGDEVHAFGHAVLSDARQRDRARQHFEQAVFLGHAEIAVQLALAEISVDQQHALAHAALDESEVGRQERFAHARYRAGEHHHVVGRLAQRRLQHVAKRPQAFDGW
ncbi:hypothetical protein D3C73_758160 [compost metagenome]